MCYNILMVDTNVNPDFQDTIKRGTTALHNNPATRDSQKTFLSHYPECFTIHNTCKITGISRKTVENWFDDPSFVAEFEIAKREATELLEIEARRRGMSTSDVLLIFLLKAHNPGKYRENINVNIRGNVSVYSADQIALIERVSGMDKRVIEGEYKELPERGLDNNGDIVRPTATGSGTSDKNGVDNTTGSKEGGKKDAVQGQGSSQISGAAHESKEEGRDNKG